ncbi:hypothetical protein AB0436_01385 [Streptomyces sp. NPDC051322]|uniref:hypothetical protein n=1 Tax=Streptomyces sp. NPDC051322 TaxID=3154645 RepID=UPI00344E686F
MSTPAKELKGRAARLARLLPARPSRAARTPFVLLVVLLLGGGLIGLLMLNSALNAGSFQLSKYEKRNTELTDEEQALQRDVDDRSAPGALAKRAGELGMVPGGGPVFLNPDGTVRGVPAQVTAEPARAFAPESEPAATPDATLPDTAPDTTPGTPSGTPAGTPAGMPGADSPVTPRGTAANGASAPAASLAPADPTTEPTPTPGR